MIKLDVEEIGPSLRYATAAVTRTGAGPRQEPAPHPADSFSISGREYAGRWPPGLALTPTVPAPESEPAV